MLLHFSYGININSAIKNLHRVRDSQMKAFGFEKDLLQFHSFIREILIKKPSELVKYILFLYIASFLP